jgi:hypothetical protein
LVHSRRRNLCPNGRFTEKDRHRLAPETFRSRVEPNPNGRGKVLSLSALGILVQANYRLLIFGGLLAPEGVVRSGKQVPALGCETIAAAARQRTCDLVQQTQLFVQDPAHSLPTTRFGT